MQQIQSCWIKSIRWQEGTQTQIHTGSDVPWAHVPLRSVHPFRLKHPQSKGTRDVHQFLLSDVIYAIEGATRGGVALVCSLFLGSSLYTEGGRERGSELLQNTQCSALPCQPALCTAANPTMPLWIFYLPSQELKNTLTHHHTEDTYTHFEDIQMLTRWGIQVTN